MLRQFLGPLLLAALMGAPGMGRAQTGPRTGQQVRQPSGQQTGQQAGASPAPGAGGAVEERRRLRIELDRVNAEIDALKRDGRGLRDDYRLRNRMADAEALARRLTELDARQPVNPPSGSARGPSAGVARGISSPWPAAPEAQPSDDRAVLEAKADILADQARRLNIQADALAGRVTALRGRQELRRRAGQLERDPFSQLEQAKRRLSAASGSQTLTGGPGSKEVVDVGGGTRTDITGTSSTPTTSIAPPGRDVGGGQGPVTITTIGAVPSAPAGFVSKAQPTPAGGSLGTTDGAPGSVAAQFRGILDASTLADIRRLELSGSPAGSVPAMERALSALRARAAELSGSADRLRTRAKTTP